MGDSTGLFEDYKRNPGDRALSRLLEHHREAILRVCRRVLRHPQDAEDACQEVLLEVSRHAGSIEQPRAFSGWLYRTALHTALDLHRKRSRQRSLAGRSRPSAVSGSATDLQETLYEGLSRLDEPSRDLIVEHYLAERPLRELAAERGCSQVSIWKRIRGVRERLRSTIGQSAMAALGESPGGTGLLRSLSGKLFGLKGGWVVGGAKLAIAAPLGLAALAGIVLYVRGSGAPPPAEPRANALAQAPALRRPAAEPLGTPVGGAVPPGGPERAVPARLSVPRKPYPYKGSSLSASGGAILAWSILSTKRITIDLQNVTLSDVLNAISRLTGLRFNPDPGLLEGQQVTIVMSSIVADGCLRLLLGPRSLGYEIQPDGVVRLGRAEDLSGGFERAARAAEAPLQELAIVAERLTSGWDGLEDLGDRSKLAAAALGRKIVVPQGESTLNGEFERLHKTENIYVHLDLPEDIDPQDSKAIGDILGTPFLQAVEERSLGNHLDQLARRAGLVPVAMAEDIFLLTTRKMAAGKQAEADERKKAYQESLARLDRVLPDGGTFDVQDFVEWARTTHGMTVVPSEEAWNSATTFTIPPGSTLRTGLGALKAQGYRWALYEGKLYLLH